MCSSRVARAVFAILSLESCAISAEINSHVAPKVASPSAGLAIASSLVIGGSYDDWANATATDAAGNIYIAGKTNSPDFPVVRALQPSLVPGECNLEPQPPYRPPEHIPCSDALIMKLDPSGHVVFATFFGGKRDDYATGIAVGNDGAIYISGNSYSEDFPGTGALPLKGTITVSPFVAKLAPDGSSVIYSVRLASTGLANAVAVDSGGNAYVTGSGAPELGTPGAFQPVPASNPLWRSADRGATWSSAGWGLRYVEGLAADPITPGLLYAGTDLGIFKSTDAGESWTLVYYTGPTKGKYDLVLDPRQPATIYANPDYGGVVRSTDAGKTWREVNNGLMGQNGPRAVDALAIDPANPSVLYAASGGVYKSTDAGETWAPTGLDVGTPPQTYITRILIPPLEPATIYACCDSTGQKLLVSRDAGATWTAGTQALPGLHNSPVALDPQSPSTLYASGSDGLFRSMDRAQTWQLIPTPIPSSALPVSALAVDPAAPCTILAGVTVVTGKNFGGVYRTTDCGQTWTVVPGLNVAPHVFAFSASTPDAVYAGVQLGRGQGAFEVKLNPEGGIVYATHIGDEGKAIAVDASGNAYVAGTTSSPDFPVVGAVQPQLAGQTNAFVTKLNAAGTGLAYSTYLGGEEGSAAAPIGIAIDAVGAAYVTGTFAADFPLVKAAETAPGGFLAKFSPEGSRLEYSTYLGGGGAIAVDANGRAFVAGTTVSRNVPLRQALKDHVDDADVYVAGLDAEGRFLFSTYLGGSNEEFARGVAVANGRVIVTGGTRSSDFPGAGANLPFNGQWHLFIATLTMPADIRPAPDIPQIAAVLNAAAFNAAQSSGVAPGMIVAIFGAGLAGASQSAGAQPLPTTLADTAVFVNGSPAPLFYVSETQINAQVPPTISGTSAAIEVRRTRGASAPFVLPLQAAAPGIFTVNQQGTGLGAVLHASNFHLVSDAEPAVPGEYLAIYCTGLGALNAGLTTTVPEVRISGKLAEVSYSGEAPTLTGVYQVNIKVPDGISAGQQRLELAMAGIFANPVIVAISTAQH